MGGSGLKAKGGRGAHVWEHGCAAGVSSPEVEREVGRIDTESADPTSRKRGDRGGSCWKWRSLSQEEGRMVGRQEGGRREAGGRGAGRLEAEGWRQEDEQAGSRERSEAGGREAGGWGGKRQEAEGQEAGGGSQTEATAAPIWLHRRKWLEKIKPGGRGRGKAAPQFLGEGDTAPPALPVLPKVCEFCHRKQ